MGKRLQADLLLTIWRFWETFWQERGAALPNVELFAQVSTGAGLVDLDRDGWLDLVVANGNDMALQRLAVYYNRGDGTLPQTPDWQSESIHAMGSDDRAGGAFYLTNVSQWLAERVVVSATHRLFVDGHLRQVECVAGAAVIATGALRIDDATSATCSIIASASPLTVWLDTAPLTAAQTSKVDVWLPLTPAWPRLKPR